MDEHHPERLKLIFGSDAARRPSIGNAGKQGSNPTHREPPTTEQVPAPLRRSPSPAEQGSTQQFQGGVQPNGYTFEILISACENKGLFKKSDELLDNALKRGIYQDGLGYNKEANELDFHRKKIHTDEASAGGVSVAFALALFRRHRAREVNFGPGTLLIVGRHGEDLIKDAIVECIEAERGIADISERMAVSIAARCTGPLRVNSRG